MEVKVVERNEETIIGGFSVELTNESETEDAEILYSDLYKSKMERLRNFAKSTKEYYGILWYTKLHEDHKYLVGQELAEESKEYENKIIPKGIYACSKFPKNYDRIKAWTDFYSEGIPEIGYKPVEQNDIAFEYYPNGREEEYELWSLVEKT